jgi:hypothetical protein
MEISFYISELLFGNDCVILPGFGGFVTHYAPARIHPINHNFLPPSKSILFNSKLIRDDGLLTDHIADRQGISYSDAKQMVEAFSKKATTMLFNGEVVRLKNIGSIQRDATGKLLFTPEESVNYLEEAYGLPAFVSPPIKRKPIHKRVEARFVDRKPVSGREHAIPRKYWAYAVAVPVLLLLGWFLFFGPVRFKNTQQSGMVTLPDSEQVTKNPEVLSAPVHEAEEPPLESLDLRDPGSRQVAMDEAAASKEEKKQALVTRKYFIIGGAFGVESNADKLVAVLRQKGFTAERAGLSPSGLHMVSYLSTPDKSEALVNLGMIRAQENPSAWLIRK